MKYRILYVEDEQILGQLVRESLEKKGYDVMLINNGFDVLAAYRVYNPHLCLLDVMLPGKDGYEVARQLRVIDAKIPILFLTAKVQVNDVVAGFNTGGNDYIRKPFSMEEVAARINSWLGEKYGSVSRTEVEEYEAGTCKFHPAKQLLVTSEARVDLTYKESALLAIFFAHKNEMVSRDYLLQKVWGTDTVYNSRTLDVYINRLRKHFEKTTNRILTLKGVGYKFLTE